MERIIHKADYNRKFEKYFLFNNKIMSPSVICVGTSGIRAGKSYTISRTWGKVTCKHCLKKKPTDNKEE